MGLINPKKAKDQQQDPQGSAAWRADKQAHAQDAAADYEGDPGGPAARFGIQKHNAAADRQIRQNKAKKKKDGQ
ncbi:hypothetical protein [Streptomyces sp. TS71-3]|uniref:hypothetical protein n=1 Tax=Streptomyces sp. TS71-3 TaxID=2733862 RepID=UPI001AFDF065|nr:hypothetical protein [Streptomyces sp. TS71-3]GHJ36022.1 hypothetical protein Sm713_16310 [Streptomyces sp. TS71-3]